MGERSVKTFVKGITLERVFNSDWKLCEEIGTLSKIKEAVASFAIESGWENWQSVYVDERGGEIYKGGRPVSSPD